MTPRRIYSWLAGLTGALIAQVICFSMMLVIVALLFRAYEWLNANLSGGLNPTNVIMGAVLIYIVISGWRAFASTREEE